MGLRELFSTMITFFTRQQIDYAVIGAFGLQAYGYIRATRDIDFITHIKHQAPIVAYISELGFETISQSTTFSNHLHPVGSARIDIMYVDGTTADTILTSVKKMPLFGADAIPVVTPEHLIALKLFAAYNDATRKHREFADIQQLLGCTSVDKLKVRGFFNKYGFGAMYDELTQ